MTRQHAQSTNVGVVKPDGRYLPLVLLLAAAGVNAADNPEPDGQAVPNLELLEFLGSFATEEGQWIDPNSLLEDEFSALLDAYADRGSADSQQTDDMANQDADND